MCITYNIINCICFLSIVIGIIYLFIIKSKDNESFDIIQYNPGYNKVSVSPYYNPFHAYMDPLKLDYIIKVPDEYKSNASKTWLANKTYICSNYDNKSNGIPSEPQDCPDSSFTYVDNIGQFVPGSDNNLNYPGCIQLKEGSNYCYSNEFGDYVPNVEVLNQRSS